MKNKLVSMFTTIIRQNSGCFSDPNDEALFKALAEELAIAAIFVFVNTQDEPNEND